MLNNSANRRIKLLLLMIVFSQWIIPIAAADDSCASPELIINSKSQGAHLTLAIWDFDPWNEVIGSESPLFALYDDNTVVFFKGRKADQPTYYSAKLSSNEALQLKNRLLPLDSDDFSTSEASDQPSSLLWWRDQTGKPKRISVYGHLIGATIGKSIPSEVINLFLYLKSFNHSNANPWLPEKIEIMISPAYSPNRFEWPKDWPDLNDKTTRKWGDSLYNYSIYLPVAYFRQFIELAKIDRHAKINGDCYVLRFRYPFVDENATKLAPEKDSAEEKK